MSTIEKEVPYSHIVNINYLVPSPESFITRLYDAAKGISSILDLGADSGVFNYGYWDAKPAGFGLRGAASFGASITPALSANWNTKNNIDPTVLTATYQNKTYDLVQAINPVLEQAASFLTAIAQMELVARKMVILRKNRVAVGNSFSVKPSDLVALGYKVGIDDAILPSFIAWKVLA